MWILLIGIGLMIGLAIYFGKKLHAMSETNRMFEQNRSDYSEVDESPISEKETNT